VPLSGERAEKTFVFVGAYGGQTAVDLGCGRGSFLLGVVAANRRIRGFGRDLDTDAIEFARATADRERLSDRVLFEVGDARDVQVPFDAAICIGSSHIFKDSKEMFGMLADLVPRGVAVVGDGIWSEPPDEWCRSTFGALPIGVEQLADLARSTGWVVESAETSTLSEWDQFETVWRNGVRSVGTDRAARFAEERADEYQRYSGVLGFGWLLLRRH
jgi:cyclopropane fatty-acyl-phospholipid synthase-like methyltransferase